MQNRTLSTSYLVVSTVFASLSIPSAYLFGLSWPLREGLVAFLDSSFYSGELFRLTLGLVGVTAFSRISSVTYSSFLPIKSAPIGDTLKQKLKRYAYLLIAYLTIAIPYLLLLLFFLGPKLILQFLLMLWLLIGFTMFMYAALSEENDNPESMTVSSYLTRSFNIREYAHNPALIVTNLSLAIALSLAFGYFRIVSLSISHPYCIVTDDGRTEAAIIGKAADGLLVATVQERDWVPFTLPMGMPIVHDYVFGFISRDKVAVVYWTCEKSPIGATTGLKQ